MYKNHIGIDTISFYIPENRIAIKDIIEHRAITEPSLQPQLIRGYNTTQQEYLRLSPLWQDTVCLASQSSLSLLQDTHIQNTLESLRYIVSATETSTDAAKPIAAYMLGILQKQFAVPHNIMSYQTQHACASGVISILQTIAFLQTTATQKSALISASDIAHYPTPSSAEITQGSASVSMHISHKPRLLSIDTTTVGVHSVDVDDFFRPMDSTTAMVKGSYSMKCFITAAYQALLDFAIQQNKTVEQVIDEQDYIVFHAPFATMPIIAITKIFRNYLSKTPEEIESILEDKKIKQTTNIITQLGNMYTASIFFVLGYLLNEEYKTLQDNIIGKKILMVSYGAGSTAVVMQATVEKEAAQIISQWNLQAQIDSYTDISMKEYDEWCSLNTQSIAPTDISSARDSIVYINTIRDDFYREYDILCQK